MRLLCLQATQHRRTTARMWLSSLIGSLRAELWTLCMRKGVNHRDDNTTGICEGFHSAIKGVARASGSEKMRLDQLIYWLTVRVTEWHWSSAVSKHTGVPPLRSHASSARASSLRVL